MRRRRLRKRTSQTEVYAGYAIIAVGVLYAISLYTPSIEIVMPLVVLVICGILLVGLWFYYSIYLKEQARRQALLKLSMSQVDTMTGVEFEKYIEALFKRDGYKTQTTSYTGDYGVDILATKNRVRIAIQCKRYTKALDQTAIREVYAGMAKYGCDKGIVITNRSFTKHATTLAHSIGCVLIDRGELAQIAHNSTTLDRYI